MARRPIQPVRRRNRGLVWLVALVWIALGAALLYQFYLRPAIRATVRDQVRQQLGQPVATVLPGTPMPTIGTRQVAGAIDIPGAVAALPAGEFTVTEAQINAYVAGRLPSMKPLDRASVRLVPGEVQVQLGAYGLSSTARMGLAVQEGQLLAVNPRLEGPLAGVLDVNDVIGPLQQSLNQELAAQGRTINTVSIGNGTITARVDQ